MTWLFVGCGWLLAFFANCYMIGRLERARMITPQEDLWVPVVFAAPLFLVGVILIFASSKLRDAGRG